jgi:DNA-binding transcriptional LysR family regulator
MHYINTSHSSEELRSLVELRQLDIFRILAHELNFTKASKRAHCVQSNVSVQIRAMEQELGVPLFERLGQQVRLTAHGSVLLPYAERILCLLEEANSVTKGGDNPIGTLVIGSPESVLTYRLPPVLKLFRAKHPQVELVFRGVGSTELMSDLERGELDLGLVIDDGLKDPRLHVEALCQEPMLLVTQADHPLVTRIHVRAKDLAGQTFLLTDAGCAYRSKLEHALAQSNIQPKSVMEFTSVETIKQCAALGMGIACLPALVVDQELATGKLATLPWSGPALAMKTLVAWHKDKWLSPAMTAFLMLLREHLSSNTVTKKIEKAGADTQLHSRRNATRKALPTLRR